MLQKPPLSPKQRRQLIKQYVVRKTHEEIAKECRCTRMTIQRDIASMKKSGEWWQWIEYELHRLHKDGNISDESKYREMSKLYAKQFIKEKSQTDVSGDFVLRWKTDDPDPDDSLQPT